MTGIKKEKIGTYLFWSIFILKVAGIFFFPTIKEAKELFVPFLNYANQNSLKEAYIYFFNNGNINIFPYSRIMYLGVSIYSLIFSHFLDNDYSIVFIRIALFTYDLVLFRILINLIKSKRKVILYYWCSPILFYINYIYTQLDVIPLTFLFLSAYYLLKNKNIISLILLGLSISAKINGAIVLPFYLFYLYRKNVSVKKSIFLAILPLLVYCLINIDLVINKEFVNMVLLNRQQSSILNMKIDFYGNSFYFVPVIYLALLLVAIKFKFYSQDLFIIFLCFSFLILTSFGINNEGWYYWVVPFLAYFYSKNKNYSKEIYLFFNAFYFLFFISRNLNIKVIENIFFTLFQFALYLNAWIIYVYGVKNITQCKLKYIPILIGIGGDSGVGKTTFTNLLENLFFDDEVLTIKGDDMHRWERGDDNWKKLTHLSPKANMLYQNYKHLEELKAQKNIERRHYDHNTGKFTDKILMKSKRIIIFEGLHPFYLKKNRNLYDLKIFVRPEENLRLHWKITRDMETRGYTREKVLEQLSQRKEDSIKYIDIQEKYADLVISYYNINNFKEVGGSNEKVDLGLQIKLDNTLDLGFIIDEIIDKSQMTIEHRYEEDYQILRFEGNLDKNIIDSIFRQRYSEIREVFGENFEIKSGYEGILQLLVINFIFEFSLKGGK